MTTEATPTPEPTPAVSLLFPDMSTEDVADAAKQAMVLSTPSMPCDADDVLLALYLSSFGEHILRTGDAKLRTPTMKALFDPKNIAGQRSLVCLAKMLRRLYDPAERPEQIEVAGLDLVKTLTIVLVSTAPDRKKLGKHPGG